jgi:hypothetical protein
MSFQPASSLTKAHVFSAIQALGQSCQLLLACHSSFPGCILARLWVGHPTKGEHNVEAIQSKFLAKNVISAFLAEIWHTEWISSPNGTTTRLLFPEVSFSALHLHHRSNAVTFQLLSGHCALNSNQHHLVSLSPPPALVATHLNPSLIFCLTAQISPSW